MSEATKTQKISKESVAEIAAHLSAVLMNPDCPSDLYNAIGDEVCSLSNDLTTPEYSNSANYINMVLLASINGEMPEETAHFNGKQSTASTLPELLSAAFNHPNMDSDLRIKLWESLNDTDRANIDSPEFLGAMLGIKAYGEANQRQLFPRKDLRTSFGKGWTEAKQHVDLLIDESQHEPEFFNALILLFGVIKQQDNLDRYDLLRNLQDYVFSHTRGFDLAADDYIASLETSDNEQEKEPNENEPDNSESAGSTISAPILEIPQNLAFAENQHL